MKSTEEKQGNESVCQNGTANFGLTGSTDQSGPPSEVVPNTPVGGNWNGPIYSLDLKQKLPAFLA